MIDSDGEKIRPSDVVTVYCTAFLITLFAFLMGTILVSAVVGLISIGFFASLKIILVVAGSSWVVHKVANLIVKVDWF